MRFIYFYCTKMGEVGRERGLSRQGENPALTAWRIADRMKKQAEPVPLPPPERMIVSMKIQNVLVAIPADEAHRAKLEAAAALEHPSSTSHAKEGHQRRCSRRRRWSSAMSPPPADRFPQSKNGSSSAALAPTDTPPAPCRRHHPDQCHPGLRPDHLGAHAGLDPELDEASAHLPGPPSREAVERCRPR